MRRVLRASLPAFSHFFGIHPWQIDDLTFGEMVHYQRALRELTKDSRGR